MKGNNNISSNSVKSLITEGRIREALMEMHKVETNEDKLNQIIFQLGRLANLNKDVGLGILSHSEEKTERNRITNAVISLYGGQIEQKATINENMKYDNLTKSETALEFFNYLDKISPLRRPRVRELIEETKLAQKKLTYSQLQSKLEEIGKAEMSPNVDNFHDSVFKSNYDNWVENTKAILKEYIQAIDKYSQSQELPHVALSRLRHEKHRENLFLWADSLIRACGSRIELKEKLESKFIYWGNFLEGKSEIELEIIIDNQVIDDILLFCKNNELN